MGLPIMEGPTENGKFRGLSRLRMAESNLDLKVIMTLASQVDSVPVRFQFTSVNPVYLYMIGGTVKINYDYIGEAWTRRSLLMTEKTAHEVIGDRTMSGWEPVVRIVQGPTGPPFKIVYFLNVDSVWCVFVEESA